MRGLRLQQLSPFPDPLRRQPATHSASARAPRFHQTFLSTPASRAQPLLQLPSKSESSTSPPPARVAYPCAVDREAADRSCTNGSSSSARSEYQTFHGPLSRPARGNW